MNRARAKVCAKETDREADIWKVARNKAALWEEETDHEADSLNRNTATLTRFKTNRFCCYYYLLPVDGFVLTSFLSCCTTPNISTYGILQLLHKAAYFPLTSYLTCCTKPNISHLPHPRVVAQSRIFPTYVILELLQKAERFLLTSSFSYCTKPNNSYLRHPSVVAPCRSTPWVAV